MVNQGSEYSAGADRWLWEPISMSAAFSRRCGGEVPLPTAGQEDVMVE